MGYFDNIRNTRRIITSTEVPLEELEFRMSLVNGERLNEKASLTREYMTLLSMFAHDVDFSNEKYQDFNLILMHISVLINNYEELDEIDKMALKKMIVFLGLNIGAPISYLSVFEDMRRSRELYISYNKLKRLGVIAPKKLMHTYRVLTIKLGRYPSLLKDIIINKNKFTADEMYLNNNYKLEDMRVDLSNENTKIYYNKLTDLKVKNHRSNKRIQFTKYAHIDRLIDEVLLEYINPDFIYEKEDYLFLQMMITYLEIILLENPSYDDVYELMIRENYIDELMDYETLIKTDSFNLKYFQRRFYGFGKTKRK